MSDLIDRQEAIDAIESKTYRHTYLDQIEDIIKDLPSIQRDTDEFCTDCKEYDTEHHCCPRWNRVIRETLKDAQPEVIRCKDCEDYQTDWETSAGLHYCAIIDTDMPPDGFCSKATRKGEQS